MAPPSDRADGLVDPAVDLRLSPLARPLRRPHGEVQFGLDPTVGIVVGGLSEVETAWLMSLPLGRAAGTTLGSGGWGLSPTRVGELVTLLRRHGLVAGAPARSRGEEQVLVLGRGPLAARVRSQLRCSGVGRVTDHLRDDDPPDLAVLLVAEALSTHEARHWADSHITHLPVVVSSTRATVGPLVVAPSGPCLVCLDLARSDRDPGWPRILNQICSPTLEGCGPLRTDRALATTLSGVVDMVVQTQLSGGDVPSGVSWEVRPPAPTITARRWHTHPRCPVEHGDGAAQAATGSFRGRPRGRLRGTTTPESSS